MRAIRKCQKIVVDKNSSAGVASDGPVERRKEPRYTAGGAVTFRLVLGGDGDYHPGELGNVSRSGLNLRSSRNLPVGSLVEVRMNGYAIVGDVRYCRKLKASQFEAGIWIAAANSTAARDVVAAAEEAPEPRAA